MRTGDRRECEAFRFGWGLLPSGRPFFCKQTWRRRRHLYSLDRDCSAVKGACGRLDTGRSNSCPLLADRAIAEDILYCYPSFVPRAMYFEGISRLLPSNPYRVEHRLMSPNNYKTPLLVVLVGPLPPCPEDLGMSMTRPRNFYRDGG